MAKILLTGATGYVGGLLLKKFANDGHGIRVLARDPSRLSLNQEGMEAVRGDIRNLDSVRQAMRGCEVAYYLVHGLNERSAFEHEEALAAMTFTKAANTSGLKRIIYLGGLGPEQELSPHLRSRQLTGSILGLGRVPVTEFRASIVLGKGSTSYEMMKLLVQRLPFFIDPSNLRALCQPIYFEDLVNYLAQELVHESSDSRLFEIGGADSVTYPGLLLRVALHSGIKRPMVPVPEVDLRILSEAFELICPEYSRVGRHLMESLTYPTVVTSTAARAAFPEINPLGIGEALDRIGTFESNPVELLSREHMTKILKALSGRFGILPSWAHR